MSNKDYWSVRDQSECVERIVELEQQLAVANEQLAARYLENKELYSHWQNALTQLSRYDGLLRWRR